jgi:glycosyltransferase involved in cell wall biosynthesis
MVAANKGLPPRKAFGEVFAAWAEFVKDHPKALLYIHSLATEEMRGMNLIEGAARAGVPEDNIRFADPYQLIMTYPQPVIAALYQAADVLLSPSYGEGFGVPIVEAQACGCPVIVNDCTSMPELCFGGWLTDNQKFYTPQGSYQFIPRIESILDCLRKSYSANSSALGRKAVNGARNYDADLVAEKYWKPVLDNIEKQIKHTEKKPELVTF